MKLKFGFKEREKYQVRDPHIELPGTGLRLMVDIIEKNIYLLVFQMRVCARFRFL
jgi:hypothetical protein